MSQSLLIPLPQNQYRIRVIDLSDIYIKDALQTDLLAKAGLLKTLEQNRLSNNLSKPLHTPTYNTTGQIIETLPHNQ